MGATVSSSALPRLRLVPNDLEARPHNPLAPLAHVAFCYRCALFCVPLGTKERCPECQMVYPRE